MIPEFPNFKKLELSDKKDIERFTSSFPPHSDFNFFSIWSWDIHHKMRISKLNENLVVLFNDYVSGENFLSFMGNKKIIGTTAELISFSRKHYHKDFLKLIPEEIILNYKGSRFTARADRDYYDYIYLTEHLANMKNWTQNTCARKIRKFIRMHPNHTVKVLSAKSISKNEYKKLFERWSKNKGSQEVFELNEYKAFERFLKINDKNIKFISVYVDKILAGFSAYEILSKNYAIAHFSKADAKNYPAVFEFLNWEEAKFFHARGIKYLNWEQDLGISSLRYSKEKYGPCFLFRKFVVLER